MGIEWIDAVGHVAEFLLVYGTWKVARQKREGFFYRLMGGALWLFAGHEIAMTSIWMWAVVFIAVDIYGLWSWRKRLR